MDKSRTTNITNLTLELECLFKKYDLCRVQARQIAGLAAKLQNSSMTIAVIGQFKRGKTTLVNNILEKELLPIGIVPITAAVTRISFGEESVQVIFDNGLKKDVAVSELGTYISEQKNHDNHLGVAEVEVHTNAEFLKSGLTLVDTPGVGSVHEKNSLMAYDFVKESDAVVFMLSVDSPINKIETEFLQRVKHYAGKFYFVVNKTDIIDERELEEYVKYCTGLLEGLMESSDVRLFPVSAKKGKGVKELTDVIAKDMAGAADEIMEQSVKLKLLEILNNSRQQISSYRNVLKMTPSVFNSRFKEMHEIIEKRKNEIRACGERDCSAGGVSCGESSCPAGDIACGEAPVDAVNAQPQPLPATKINEEKNYLKLKVKELFGIEYYYDIEQSVEGEMITAAEYKKKVQAIYTELEATLNTIFLYKEENAYIVAKRIEDLNILMRKTDKFRSLLQPHK